jgi:hypothetical protein
MLNFNPTAPSFLEFYIKMDINAVFGAAQGNEKALSN